MKMTGVETVGTFMRMDGKIIKVDKIVDAPKNILSASEIIKQIQELV
jgi:formylmethanofuran dehydrogenase subunit B